MENNRKDYHFLFADDDLLGFPFKTSVSKTIILIRFDAEEIKLQVNLKKTKNIPFKTISQIFPFCLQLHQKMTYTFH